MSAPMTETCVKSYIEKLTEDESTIVNQLSTGLVSGELQLVTFIETLQKYLTSPDVSIRARCVRLVGEVLHQIPNKHLSEDEVELLGTYMCERLADHHSVQPPALYALLALSSSSNLPQGLASKICRVIFQNVQNQSLSQADRSSVYTIISNFLDKKMEELQKMEGDFVLGFIQVMDTEKDPRNLLICFRCARTIILNFPLGVFTEEMFEVTSCYFPIDFTPPPSDNKITRDDLIKGLRGCLSASEKFGEYAYPLIMEKLTSDVQSAKLDCLQTLIECIEIYGTKPLKEFQSSLYNCIKREVFSSGNPQMEQFALDTLCVIVKTLSQTKLEGPDSPLNNYVSEILQDCKRYLSEQDNNLLVPVCHLLASCAHGSDMACCQILKEVIPCLINLYNKSTLNTQKKQILEMISKFVKVTNSFPEGQCHRVFLTYLDDLSALIEGALSDSSSNMRMAGISGVNQMIKVKTPHTQRYTTLILDKVFNDEDKDVRKSCLESLETVSRVSPPVLEFTVIPDIVKRLQADPVDEVLSDVVSSVTLKYNVVTMVIPELFARLQQIAQETPDEKIDQQAKNIVTCLYTIIQKNYQESHSFQYMCNTVIRNIYQLVIVSSLYPASSLQHIDLLRNLAACVRCITTQCDKRQLEEIYRYVSDLFLLNKANDLPEGSFKPLDVTSSSQQTQLVVMLTPVICLCNEKLPDEDLYVQKLLSLCRNSQHQPTQSEACKCLADLVNKHPEILQHIDTLELEQEVTCKTSQNRKSALQLMIWLTKSLVMRGHSNSQAFVLILMSVLSDPDLGHDAAMGFTIILSDSPDVLNKSMKSVIRMMYKQRLFVENVPYLIKSFETTSQDTKKNYLKVLSAMLKTLPKQVLLNELPPLFPLMVHSLLSDDLDLQISTMDSLYDLTHDAPEIITKHVDTLIPKLVVLTGDQRSMKLRQHALQCIGVLTVLPAYVVLPYKQKVIKALEKPLDDKKRLIRKEAVMARNEWFLLGTASK